MSERKEIDPEKDKVEEFKEQFEKVAKTFALYVKNKSEQSESSSSDSDSTSSSSSSSSDSDSESSDSEVFQEKKPNHKLSMMSADNRDEYVSNISDLSKNSKGSDESNTSSRSGVDHLHISSDSSLEAERFSRKNILVLPSVKMEKVCLYCKIEDDFTFNGKFKNCEIHGGNNKNKEYPCFQCIIKSNGQHGRFKLCEFHKDGAAAPYKILKLRTMTKVIKIENTPENVDKIENVKRKLPVDTTGSSLGNRRRILIVSSEKAKPALENFYDLHNLHAKDNLKIRKELNLENVNVNLEKGDEEKKGLVLRHLNQMNINQMNPVVRLEKLNENQIRKLKLNNQLDKTNQMMINKSVESSETQHGEISVKTEVTSEDNSEQLVDNRNSSSKFQEYNPGLDLAEENTGNGDTARLGDLANPDPELAIKVLGKNKINLKTYSKIKQKATNFHVNDVLDRDLIPVADDKVWIGWKDAISRLFKHVNDRKDLNEGDLIDLITTLIKINANYYLKGSDFLLDYSRAKEKDREAARLKFEQNLLEKVNRSVKQTLTDEEGVLHSLKSAIGVKVYQTLTSADYHDLQMKEIRKSLDKIIDEAVTSRSKPTVADMEVEMEAPPAKRPRELVRMIDNRVEINLGDNVRTFTEAEIGKMVQLFDNDQAGTSSSAITAEPMMPVAPPPPAPKTIYTIGSAFRPTLRGGRGGRGPRGGQRGNFAQSRMDQKRKYHVEQATSGSGYTFQSIMKLGDLPNCPPEMKAKAIKCREVLENRIKKVLSTKPPHVYNEAVQTYLPPSNIDLRPGETTVPEERLWVMDTKTVPHKWIKITELRDTLWNQWVHQTWYDHESSANQQ